MRLKGQFVLVTGASRGIGKAIALACAREGATVAVNGRDVAKVAETVAAIVGLGREAMPIVADVGDTAAARSMIDRAIDAFGRLDVFVNNAGLYQRKPI